MKNLLDVRQGRFVDGGAERRFCDHDYRLLIEHGAIPKDTILVAGIVFWQHGASRDGDYMSREEEWIYDRRRELQHPYGAGTFVAVYDWAVIDWGDDADAVRQRAEAAIGDAVFVGPVSPDRPFDITQTTPETWNAHMEEFRAYRERCEAAGDKRRFRLAHVEGPQSFYAVAELDIWGQKTEFVDGVTIGSLSNTGSCRRRPS